MAAKEQIVLNGYWPKLIAGFFSTLIVVGVAGLWTAAVEFGALRKSVEVATEQANQFTEQVKTVLKLHEQDQKHIDEDHQEFRQYHWSMESRMEALEDD